MLPYLRIAPKAPKDEDGCPYRGGTFLLTCDLPQEYPRSPPEIRFVTFILHPNVSLILLQIASSTRFMLIMTCLSRSRSKEKCALKRSSIIEYPRLIHSCLGLHRAAWSIVVIRSYA